MCTEINTYALVIYTGRKHASFTLCRQRELINFYFYMSIGTWPIAITSMWAFCLVTQPIFSASFWTWQDLGLDFNLKEILWANMSNERCRHWGALQPSNIGPQAGFLKRKGSCLKGNLLCLVEKMRLSSFPWKISYFNLWKNICFQGWQWIKPLDF